ncbi:MAG: hypothetical protein IPH10_11200 [bacterium]|nr:hypothetical protein [bacterium]
MPGTRPSRSGICCGWWIVHRCRSAVGEAFEALPRHVLPLAEPGKLADRSSAPRRSGTGSWKKKGTIIANALLDADLSPRQLAFRITDDGGFSVSGHGLPHSEAQRVSARVAADHPGGQEYHRKTTRVNER